MTKKLLFAQRMTWAGFCVMAAGILVAAFTHSIAGAYIVITGGVWLLFWFWRSLA